MHWVGRSQPHADRLAQGRRAKHALRCEQSASGPHGGFSFLNALALDGFNLRGGQQRACIYGSFLHTRVRRALGVFAVLRSSSSSHAGKDQGQARQDQCLTHSCRGSGIFDALSNSSLPIACLAARIALNTTRGVSKAKLPVSFDVSAPRTKLRAVERLKQPASSHLTRNRRQCVLSAGRARGG